MSHSGIVEFTRNVIGSIEDRIFAVLPEEEELERLCRVHKIRFDEEMDLHPFAGFLKEKMNPRSVKGDDNKRVAGLAKEGRLLVTFMAGGKQRVYRVSGDREKGENTFPYSVDAKELAFIDRKYPGLTKATTGRMATDNDVIKRLDAQREKLVQDLDTKGREVEVLEDQVLKLQNSLEEESAARARAEKERDAYLKELEQLKGKSASGGKKS